MNREDEVAAVLFWKALAPETLEGMKKRLLGIAGKGETVPMLTRDLVWSSSP